MRDRDGRFRVSDPPEPVIALATIRPPWPHKRQVADAVASEGSRRVTNAVVRLAARLLSEHA
jgi:hypothetical protein